MKNDFLKLLIVKAANQQFEVEILDVVSIQKTEQYERANFLKSALERPNFHSIER